MRRQPSQNKFLRTLSASMHRMAQPLSIIQASLELALLKPTTPEQYREIAEAALQQLGRAVESMQFTAQLTRFLQPASDVGEVMLSSVLGDVLSDLSRTLDTAQIKVVLYRSEHEHPIQASPTRLRQMLFYVLQAMQSVSGPGDVIHIELQGRNGHVVLRVHHLPKKDAPNPPADRMQDGGLANRALSLADAIASSSGAKFSITTNPLLVVADFAVNRKSKLNPIDKGEIVNPQLAVSSH